MTDTPRAPTWRDWIPALSLVLTIVALLVGGGQVLAKVDESDRRLSKLEQRADRRDDELSSLGRQLARLDGKIDLLIQRIPTRP